MQERYLGDSHDFVKYALLRFLSRALRMKVGINWYLTRPEEVDREGSKDGEKRHHLNGDVWRNWEPDLFERLRPFEAPSRRRIAQVREMGILPDTTLYFPEYVPVTDRHRWHHRAKSALADADLIFLDPDNGFEVNSMTLRTSPKYALYSEAIDYFQSGKTVLGIQFVRQADPVRRGQEIRARLGCVANGIPIIRARVAPTLLFFALAPPDRVGDLVEVLSAFAENSPPLPRRRAGRRIELIP